MLGFKKSGPTLKDFDFTERLNRDRAIAEGRTPDPLTNNEDTDDIAFDAVETERAKAEMPNTDHLSETDDSTVSVATEFAEEASEYDAYPTSDQDERLNSIEIFNDSFDDAGHADADGNGSYSEPGYDTLDDFQVDETYKADFVSSDTGLIETPLEDGVPAEVTPTSPRMLALRRWLMAAVNGLVWMFLTMWTLDKLHLFDRAFSAIDVTSTAASLYVTGIAVIALASLFVYLVKTIRTAIQPQIWRSTASGLALGGLIGALDGIGPSTHFLKLIVGYTPFG